VTLKAENCEIYDYATNTWTDTLYIGHLVSEQEKTYQIRTTNKNPNPNPRESQIAIYGRTIHKTKSTEVLTDDIVLQTHAVPVIMQTIPCDLTNYMFRQKTQELLFLTKELHTSQSNNEDDTEVVDPFTKYKLVLETTKETETDLETNLEKDLEKEKEELKKKMQSFFKTMLDYVDANQMKDNAFYKMLCDDVYIAIKSFEIQNGHMFAAARHISQGRQQSYTPRFADEEQLSDLEQQPKLKRCYTLGPNHKINQNQNQNQNRVKRNNDLKGYTLSQDDTSPYSSVGQMKMMRDVSLNTNTKTKTNAKTNNTIFSLDAP
jgi:hypothetical protein